MNTRQPTWTRGPAVPLARSRRSRSVALLVLALAACADRPQGPPPSPLPPSGLPARTEALLFGSATRCLAARDCDSRACLFGNCAGLLTVDEPWQTAVVGERLRDDLATTPGLEARLVPVLAAMTADVESGLPFRARAARGLGQIGSPAALAALEAALPTAPPTLAEVMATTLVSHGRNHDGALDLVLELAGGDDTGKSVEGLRALGGLAGPSGARRDEVLVELLASLSTDIPIEEARAAIDALSRLGDARAVTPLRRFLVVGPDSLAHETATALRALMTPLAPEAAALSTDPRAWDELLARHPPPAAPPFTVRARTSEDDLDLPTP